MKRNLQKLTISEQKLLERFLRYDERALMPVAQNILEDYKDQVFIHDIFSIIVEDVLQVLALSEWNELSYRKIIFSAERIHEMSGCFSPPDDRFLFALSIVWITHCCKYKNEAHILSSELRPHSIISDSLQLEYSLCAQFFNLFGGPPSGKARKLERYMFSTYGCSYRSSDVNDDHLMNFQTLLHFISETGFSYESPVKAEG